MKQNHFAKCLAIIASIHLGFGLFLFAPQWQAIFANGFIATVGKQDIMIAVAFWFCFFSFPLYLMALAWWHKQETVPTGIALFSLLASVFAGLLMPASGFWTLTLLASVSLALSVKRKNQPAV